MNNNDEHQDDDQKGWGVTPPDGEGRTERHRGSGSVRVLTSEGDPYGFRALRLLPSFLVAQLLEAARLFEHPKCTLLALECGGPDGVLIDDLDDDQVAELLAAGFRWAD